MTENQGVWPALPYDAWKDTYATLHMWSQIVGKITLACAPPLNHSWGIAFRVNARGLSTPLLSHAGRSFTIHFDFITHRLVIEGCDGDTRALPLHSQTVADFYESVMASLRAMSLPVKMKLRGFRCSVSLSQSVWGSEPISA